MSLFHPALFTAVAIVASQITGVAQSPAGTPLTIPDGASIELLTDRNEYFVGENILLHYRITNASQSTFSISVGGDYRGGTRANRFKVTATDAGNKEVVDPSPNQADMGGMSPGGELQPGADWYENVPINRYRKLDSPGQYRIEVFHDLGWGDRQEKDPRNKSIRLTLKEPKESDARKVVDAMVEMRKYHGDTWGKKGRAGADFTLLTHPVYLPLMEQQADPDAVTAISHMATTDATRALMRLAGHANDTTAALAGLAVSGRIPPTYGSSGPLRIGVPSFPHGTPPILPDTWTPDLAGPARNAAHGLLKRSGDLAHVSAAAILMQVGDGKDFRSLVDSLEPVANRALGPVTKTDRHEGPRWALGEITKAFEQFASRGVRLSEKPESTAEFLAFMANVAASPESKKPGFEEHVAASLRHPHPVVREAAVRRLPDPLAPSLAPLVIALMADSDSTVRRSACEVVNNLKLPEGREQALKAIARSDDNWTVWMAVDVAVRDGARVECARLLADRFAELSDHPQYIGMEFMSHLCRITTGGNMAGNWHFLKEPAGRKRAREIRDAWKKMIDEHTEELRAGKLVAFGDGAFPADLIPPGVEYSAPR